MHPKAEIPTLDEAGRDVAGVRQAEDFGWDLFENAAGAIPVGASIGRGLKDFYELGVVGAGVEQIFHRFDVCAETIGGDLKMTLNAVGQLGNELVGQHHLGLRVQRNPKVGVSPLGGIGSTGPYLFRVAEAPNLVGLNELGGDRSDARVEYSLRLLASRVHQRQDGVLVQIGDAGDGADAHPLKHQGQNLTGTIKIGVVASQRLGGVIRERGFRLPALRRAFHRRPVRAYLTPKLKFVEGPPLVHGNLESLAEILDFLRLRADRMNLFDAIRLFALAILKNLDLPSVNQSSQRRMNTGQRVCINRQVHLLADQYPIPDSLRRESLRMTTNYESHGIHESVFADDFIQGNKVGCARVFVLDDPCKRLDGVRIFGDLLVCLGANLNRILQLQKYFIHSLDNRRMAHA